MQYLENSTTSNSEEYILSLWRKCAYSLVILVQLISCCQTTFLFFAVVSELPGTHLFCFFFFFQSYLLVINPQNLSMMDRACHIAEASLHPFLIEALQLLIKCNFWTLVELNQSRWMFTAECNRYIPGKLKVINLSV